MEEKWVFEALQKTVETVFESMVYMKVKGNPFDGKITLPDRHLTAMVGFAGVYMGLAAIHCSEKFAKQIGGSMLQMDPGGLTAEDVRDALGEIANMIAGYFKARLAENLQTQDNVFEQSVPSVICGDDFETSAVTDAPRYITLVETDQESFYVELALKQT